MMREAQNGAFGHHLTRTVETITADREAAFEIEEEAWKVDEAQ